MTEEPHFYFYKFFKPFTPTDYFFKAKPVCEGNEGLVPEGSLVTLRCSTYLSAMDFPEIRWRNTRGPLRSYDVSDIIAAASELRFNVRNACLPT